MSDQVPFAEHNRILHHEATRLRVCIGIPAVLRHARSKLFHSGKHARQCPVRIVALVAVMRSVIATAGRHQRRVKVEHINPSSEHFADKFTTVHVHAQVCRSSLYKLVCIDFFFHRNRDHEKLYIHGIQVLLEFNHSRERIVEAILTANFVCNEVICIAAEPEHSVIGPGILFLRELGKLFLQGFAELLCRRRCRAAIFHSGKRFQASIRTRIKHAVHRHHFTRSSQRIGNSSGTQLFIRQAERRNFKSNPHCAPHRVSAHHRKRAVCTRVFPNGARCMLFQVRIQSRVPIRRKRTGPVHCLFIVHLGRHVVVQDFERFTTRNDLELTVERSTASPNGRHDFGPPFNLSLIFARSRHTPQTAYRLESAEHFRFIPLDRLDFIQGFCKSIITSLRVKDLRKRFPRNRGYTGNRGRLIIRNRVEHREREFLKLCICHLARVIFRLFIHARHADRVCKVRRKIKSGKRRLFDDADLLIPVEHAHFEDGHRSRINRDVNRRSSVISLHGRIDRRSSTGCRKEHARRKPCETQ